MRVFYGFDGLEKEGLDNLAFVKFTPEFARISGQDFIQKYRLYLLYPCLKVIYRG